jgi:hypothetical protein
MYDRSIQSNGHKFHSDFDSKIEKTQTKSEKACRIEEIDGF